MSATMPKFYRGLLLAFLALGVSLLAASPAAKADPEFAFKPGAFDKAHTPLHQAPPSFCPGFFQCIVSNQESWIQEIEASPEATQAGGHPDFVTHFRFPTADATIYSRFLPAGHPRTIITDTPAGSVGSPRVVPRCEQAQFQLTLTGACPPVAQVGVALSATSLSGSEDFNFFTPVSSLVPSPGQPALLAFKVFALTASLVPEPRSESDYGLRIRVDHLSVLAAEYTGSTIDLWGVPHDPVHDPMRFNSDTGELGGHIEGTPKPFLSAPTNCSTGPITVRQEAQSWEHPDQPIDRTSTAAEPTGCDKVPFEPTISARPTTNVGDAPSGLEIDVSTPQHESCEQIEPAPPADESQFDCGIATSHLKDTTVTLPPGMSINPSGANGLEGCTEAQIGLTTPDGVAPQHFTKEVPHCPESSRIGSVEVDTPLLDAPAQGSVFIANPYANPFNSLLAIYIVVNDEERGFVAKLAGEVKADPLTGQLSTTVTDAPQLPFSHFLLHFKQGPHATLRTPPACGTYTTDAALTPYSQPTTPFDRQGSFTISQGPGGSCNTPNAPQIDAGSVSPIAGLATPTVINLSRPDGTQEFSKLDLTLPPGLTGKLAGISQCSDAALAAAAAKSGKAEQASPSCPASSHIGKVYVAAGAGPAPYNTTAEAYLTGPYKGAPLSMAVIAPAVAGPFDLGTVVVRTALNLNPSTGQIEAKSDEFPHILQGIPLDVRSVRIVMDRPDFTRNGTSCDPSSFSGSLTSTLGQATALSERFQLAECSSLAFKPKLAIRLFGGTKRGDHPALRGVVQMPEGGANIAKASVALPHSEFLDQAHIGTVCTRVQFAQGDGNGSACPPASIYGKATAESPLVDYALSGPAILRSSSHKLPDLVVALHGPPSQPVQADVVGRIDSADGGIRTSFEGVPDLPVSKFVLSMQGGKKGLLQNSTDICQGTHKATAKFTGQNAKVAELAPELRNGKCGAAKKRGKGRGAKGAHHR
jgi:hypothetical protein